jgi:formiminoglutamase
MQAFTVKQGQGPLILGQPHGGIDVPKDIWAKLNDNGRLLADTDWHITRLYEGLGKDVTVVAATFHRYVVDANRDPSGTSLYPGQNTTGLCPLTDFEGNAIWQPGQEPDAGEIARRVTTYHAPYHAALAAEIARVKARHGFAIVYDCHSIRSRIPFLFEGKLPDLNIGTDNGKTCAVAIETTVTHLSSRSGFTSIVNGRFRGGWTTRHYGQPHVGVHAIQMEIAQSAYLASEVAPFDYDEGKAVLLRQTLDDILTALEGFTP